MNAKLSRMEPSMDKAAYERVEQLLDALEHAAAWLNGLAITRGIDIVIEAAPPGFTQCDLLSAISDARAFLRSDNPCPEADA